MKRTRKILLTLAIVVILSIVLLSLFAYRPTFESRAPSDWQRIDAMGCFGLSAPSDLAEVKVQPKDSYVRMFESNRLSLSFDYGLYSDPLDRYASERVRISGHAAHLCSFANQPNSGHPFPLVVAVHFPDLGKGAKLTVWINCKTEEDQETARMIIGTIKIQ